MREIKFRVWMPLPDGTTNLVGYEALIDNRWAFKNPAGEWRKGTFTNPFMKRDQFTGLHDKNGKEIYEGDIIEGHDGFRWVVGFQDGGFGFESPKYGWVAFAWNEHARMNARELPVIGNIYKNPELLTV